MDRILRALGDAGYQIEKPTVKMLQQVDQLHGGGLKSTVRLAELAGVTSGMHVLDAGCGIGGAAPVNTNGMLCWGNNNSKTTYF